LEIVSPASQIQRDRILIKLKKGTSIIFYSGQRKVSSLIMCKLDNEIYAIHNKSKTPYRIAVKGYPEIDLTKLFNPERYLWTASILFNFNPDEVQSVQLFYADNPEKNFKIEKQPSGKYLIEYGRKEFQLEVKDTSLVHEYLNFFPGIKYYPVNEDKSLLQQNLMMKIPFFRLILLGKNGPLCDLQAYNKTESGSMKDDSFEFYAISKNTGLIVLKYNDFDPILAAEEYFLKK
jgi:hypothetical protein